jgi:DNA-binding response OmpR family regulator
MMPSIPAIRILLIEDDPHLAPLVRLILLRIGAEAVEVAPTGAAATDLFDTFRPRLVITDQNLPDEVGTGVITRLRARRAGKPDAFSTSSMTTRSSGRWSAARRP